MNGVIIFAKTVSPPAVDSDEKYRFLVVASFWLTLAIFASTRCHIGKNKHVALVIYCGCLGITYT